MTRPILAASGALGAAVLFASCGIGFNGTPSGTQISPKKVRVTFVACKGAATPECSDQSGFEDQDGVRILMGLRTPRHTSLPLDVVPTDVAANLHRNKSYTDALNAGVPRPGGSVWTGYMSEPFQAKDFPDTARFVVRLGLPDDVGRKFKWRPVLGLSTNDDPKDPIDCGIGTQPYQGFDNNICVDAPDSQEETAESFKIPID